MWRPADWRDRGVHLATAVFVGRPPRQTDKVCLVEVASRLVRLGEGLAVQRRVERHGADHVYDFKVLQSDEHPRLERELALRSAHRQSRGDRTLRSRADYSTSVKHQNTTAGIRVRELHRGEPLWRVVHTGALQRDAMQVQRKLRRRSVCVLLPQR